MLLQDMCDRGLQLADREVVHSESRTDALLHELCYPVLPCATLCYIVLNSSQLAEIYLGQMQHGVLLQDMRDSSVRLAGQETVHMHAQFEALLHVLCLPVLCTVLYLGHMQHGVLLQDMRDGGPQLASHKG